MNRHTKRARSECDEVIDAFSRLRRALPELERRTRLAAGNDGYPSSSLGGGGGQRGVVAAPTERAALAGRERDPIREWSRDMLKSLAQARRLAGDIDALLKLAALGETVACSKCGREDVPRLVDGRCDACRMRARRSKGA